jgi:hypothetical protein
MNGKPACRAALAVQAEYTVDTRPPAQGCEDNPKMKTPASEVRSNKGEPYDERPGGEGEIVLCLVRLHGLPDNNSKPMACNQPSGNHRASYLKEAHVSKGANLRNVRVMDLRCNDYCKESLSKERHDRE